MFSAEALFIAHAACIGADALELRCRSHPQPQHATPGLISSEPGYIPFPFRT